MPEYLSYARYYDFAHTMQEDIPFYLHYAAQHDGPLLELGCGTGRLVVPLAQAGHKVAGLDLCDDMLEICRERVRQNGLSDRVSLTQGDMSSFELPRKDFALAFVPLRSFSHLFTPQDQINCLRCVADHLRPGGALIIATFAPRYKVLAQEQEGEDIKRREFTLPDGNVVTQWERFVRNDVANQVLYFVFRFEERTPVGAMVNTVEAPMHMRYTFRYELQMLFDKAGFQVVDVFRDYDRSPFDGRGEIIMVGEKPS